MISRIIKSLLAGALSAILDDEIEHVRGLLFARAVQTLAEHGLFDAAENSFQRLAARISEQRRGRFACDQFALEVVNRCTGAGEIQNARRGHDAGRQREPPFVVLQQQAPGRCIADDEIQHGAAGVVHQRLVLQRTGQEVERLPRLEQTALGQPGLIDGVALHQMFAQHSRGPLAELHTALRVDAIPNRNNGVEVVVLDRSGDLALSFGLNYREILGSCRLAQLALREDILQVQADIVGGCIEQLGHLALGQPDSFPIQAHADLGLTLLVLINQDLAHSGFPVSQCSAWLRSRDSEGYTRWSIQPQALGSPQNARSTIGSAMRRQLRGASPLLLPHPAKERRINHRGDHRSHVLDMGDDARVTCAYLATRLDCRNFRIDSSKPSFTSPGQMRSRGSTSTSGLTSCAIASSSKLRVSQNSAARSCNFAVKKVLPVVMLLSN